MKRRCLVVPLLLAAFALPAGAATPASGAVSPAAASTSWSGSLLTPAVVTGCFPLGVRLPACDFYALSIVPPATGAYLVRIAVTAANGGDDIDLFVRDPAGDPIASSTSGSGVEEVVLVSPPAGTYTVAVRPSLVVPPSNYTGQVFLDRSAPAPTSNAFLATPVPPGFIGVPQNVSAPANRQFKVSYNPVGRQAAEPTIGVNRNNIAFFAASTFDFPSSTAPARLAHTLVLRSSDKGKTWQSVSPPLVAGLPDSEAQPTFPPSSLDPYVYVDPVGLNPSSRAGRVFSVDLDLACGANAIFSDDQGATWTKVPLFACDTPVNDHQTLITAPPPPGFPTIGYPNMLYLCFNRVSDSSCNRSRNGGLSFEPTGSPAFVGEDPAAGGFCGGLTGHLAADSKGRIFLPKGHCGTPTIALSDDAGTSWTRVKIASLAMPDHEVSLAVDGADNVYAVFHDGVFRLPFLTVSTDRGAHWSTPVLIAPPQVREVNFPTIVAGDAGRIAVLYPGTENANAEDATRPWNAYVLISTNALAASPTFTWTAANDPADPIHRGACGPDRCDAQDNGSMFDFLNIQTSPADGAVWATVSDTCVPDPDPAKNCVANPQATKLRPGQGVALRQVKGPSLFRDR